MRTSLIACAMLVAPLVYSAPADAVVRLQYHRYDGAQRFTGGGTAFAIGPTLWLTAAHNTVDSEKRPIADISVEIDGKWAAATVERSDPDNDIAMLSTTAHAAEFLPVGPDQRKGDKIVLVASLRSGPVMSYLGEVRKLWFAGRARFLAAVEFDHGGSGAPLIGNGAAVGMAVAGIPKGGDLDHEFAIFVPAIVLAEFICGK